MNRRKSFLIWIHCIMTSSYHLVMTSLKHIQHLFQYPAMLISIHLNNALSFIKVQQLHQFESDFSEGRDNSFHFSILCKV